MKIDIENGQFYYDLFYQLSFLVVTVICLIEGYKRKFPMSAWLLVLVTVQVFTIVGAKLGAISDDDFRYFVKHLQFPAGYTKNAIGALVFGLAGIGLAKQLLRIRYPVMDACAIAIPFGMMVQRAGCLMTGCCYGTVTHMPWGIQYGIHSPAFLHQFFSHEIGLSDTLTLNVHPVPLYCMVSGLVIGVLLLFLRPRLKRPGNLMIAGLALFSIARFMIEFFRDPQSNGSFQGNYVIGLKMVQLFCLSAFLILSFFLVIREKRFVRKVVPVQTSHPLQEAFYLLILSCLFYVTRNWFSKMEFQVILVVLIPAMLVVVYNLVVSYYPVVVRLPAVSLILLSVFLMSVTYPKDDTVSYSLIRFGMSGGSYSTTHSESNGSAGCEDYQELGQRFDQYYRLVGIGYSVVKKKQQKVLEYGLNTYFGTHTEKGLTSYNETSNSIFGINPFVRLDKKWWGGSLGLHVGNLCLTPVDWMETKDYVQMPTTGTKSYVIFPQLSFRFGPIPYAYIGYYVGDHFPAPFPMFADYVEIGTGLGLKNGFRMSLGYSLDESPVMFRLAIPLGDRFLLEPVYQWNDAMLPLFEENYQFSIGLQYKLRRH